MKRIKKHIETTAKKSYLALFSFFFLAGILWGKFFYYNEENRNVLFSKERLVLLAEVGFLPTDVLESFSLEQGEALDLVTYSSREELLSKLQKHKVDLVAFKSFYAQDVLKKLDRISYKNISNKDSISIDFKNLPYDRENQYAIPLFWGVEKNKDIEKSLLWVESIGVIKNSPLMSEAHQFIDFVLQDDVAIEIVRHRKIASTNKKIEKESNIESKWKPSYLRKMSIRDLAFKERAGL